VGVEGQVWVASVLGIGEVAGDERSGKVLEEERSAWPCCLGGRELSREAVKGWYYRVNSDDSCGPNNRFLL